MLLIAPINLGGSQNPGFHRRDSGVTIVHVSPKTSMTESDRL
jgi:hypothetical protein